MAIELINGSVFLHIPKTGGNWVTHVLNELKLIKKNIAPKHADLNRLFNRPSNSKGELIRKLFNTSDTTDREKPFIFCFVRNPLSWYESWFHYMQQPSRQWRYYGDNRSVNKWHPNSQLNGLGSPDFNRFVSNVNSARPGYVSELFGWYTQGQTDFVGRQENLATDLIQVLESMDLNFDKRIVKNFEKIGVSPKPATPLVWQEGLRRQTALYEYSGLVRFGYTNVLEELKIGAGSRI